MNRVIINETANPDRGVDYHMRSLGVVDRASWTMVASDNRTYTDTTIITRPDFLMEHVEQNRLVLIEYKNRLYDGRPRADETVQVMLSAVAIMGDYYWNHNRDMTLEAYLLYSSGDRIPVNVNERYTDPLMERVLNENPQAFLFLNGEMKDSRDPMPASALAKHLTGAKFTAEQEAAREAGTLAHENLTKIGPTH